MLMSKCCVRSFGCTGSSIGRSDIESGTSRPQHAEALQFRLERSLLLFMLYKHSLMRGVVVLVLPRAVGAYVVAVVQIPPQPPLWLPPPLPVPPVSLSLPPPPPALPRCCCASASAASSCSCNASTLSFFWARRASSIFVSASDFLSSC